MGAEVAEGGGILEQQHVGDVRPTADSDRLARGFGNAIAVFGFECARLLVFVGREQQHSSLRHLKPPADFADATFADEGDSFAGF